MQAANPKEWAPIGLRRASNADRDAIVALHSEELVKLGIAHDPKLDSDLEDVEGCYTSRGGEFLLAVRDGYVAAMGAFRKLDSRSVELVRLRTAEADRRQGLGRSVVRKLTEEAAGRNFKSMVLDVSSDLPEARALFESEGFELERHVEVFGRESLFYRKILTGIPGSARS